jgi:hypothetical protein
VAENRLWGDYFSVNPAEDFAQGSQAVAIWADPAQFAGDPVNTFYGRFHDYDGSDERVPLPTLWNTRFLQGGAFTGGTELIVWRDVASVAASPGSCAGHPAWWPLQESFVVARDENGENPFTVGEASHVLSLATQKVRVADLAIPYPFGHLQLALNVGPFLANPRQAWVETLMSASGRFSVGMTANGLLPLCGEPTPVGP